jgi:nucleotide-binding universal stress UspA family protein
MYKNMLISITNPKIGEAVADLASAIADKDGVLTILHVIEVPYHLPYFYADESLDSAHEIVDEFHDALTKVKKLKMKMETHVMVARDATDAIVHYAREKKHDLILLGASTRSKRKKFLFGDVVDGVLKRAPCDVIVINYLGLLERIYDRILLTTTDYEHSKEAIEIAEAIAHRHPKTKIETLCIAEKPSEVEKNRTVVNKIKRIFSREHIKSWSKVLVSSKVAKAIISEARRGKYRLILAEVTKKPPGYRFVLGSVVDELARKAPCPVLIIKRFKR